MKHPIPNRLATMMLAALAIPTSIGCDDRATRIAQQAADRQADQNREMIRLNREVAAGASRLVTEDAEARQQALRVQHQLQRERAGLTEGWSQLEAERKQLAHARRTDSALAALVSGGAATLAALAALALAWIALHRSDPADESAASAYALMIDDVLDVGSGQAPLPAPRERLSSAAADDRPNNLEDP